MKPNLFLMTIGWLAILISAHPVARPYELAFSTYFGGSAAEGIRDAEVDALSNIYVAGTTRSADFPTTPGAYDEHVDTSRGATRWGYNSDIFVAKLLPDGSGIVYGTYIGDGGDNWLNTHNLVVDGSGNCYSSTCVFSSLFPTTQGAIQKAHAGGKVDWGIVKLSPTGALLTGTLLGGDGPDNPDGIRVDSQGNLVLFGQTASANFPVSSDAYQGTKGSGNDAVVVKLSPNLDRLIYGTFLGGSGDDNGRAGCVDRDGGMIIAGSSSGKDWPTKNAFQDASKGPADALVARLAPAGANRIGSEGILPLSSMPGRMPGRRKAGTASLPATQEQNK